MQNDKVAVENDEVCDLMLNMVGKPSNFFKCKAINVYDDRYRVNIYCTREVDGIEGKHIISSYFIKYNEDNKEINIINSSKA